MLKDFIFIIIHIIDTYILTRLVVGGVLIVLSLVLWLALTAYVPQKNSK